MTEKHWLEVAEEGEGYSLEKLKVLYDVRSVDGGWIVLNQEKDNGWLRFAAMTFASSDLEGKNTTVTIQFFGMGFTGALRECRHTWWGEDGDGYLFYPNGKLIASAFRLLAEFFDEMV